MEWPLVQMVWLLTSDADGSSAEAATKIREVIGRAADQVGEACPDGSAEMDSLRERVWSTTAAPLDARGMRAVEDALGSWVESIGARRNPLQGASETVRSCDRLGDRLAAGYGIWWDYTPDGKRWWVQIEIDNETDKRYWVDLDGTMRVTGQVQPASTTPGMESHAPSNSRIEWGGSSADSMYAYPSTTSVQRVGLTEYVYTTADGAVSDVRPHVFVQDGGHYCSLPVPRLN
jgi:hypothetical protein